MVTKKNEWSLDKFILRLDRYDFQWLIWFLLQKKNFEVEVAKRTREGGVDLIGSYNDKEWLIRKKINLLRDAEPGHRTPPIRTVNH